MPRPWYETHPQEYWTSQDYELARKAGWQGIQPLPLPPVDQLPITVPRHLAPTWSPLSRPKKGRGVGAQGRAVDELLKNLGIR
jgi:hypothetical protein